MSKQEFVERLRISLNGKISPTLVEENARYYEDYINTQIRLGKAEDKVLEALGDPRLIARSIVAAESVKTSETEDEYREYDGSSQGKTDSRERIRQSFSLTGLPRWAVPVIAVTAMILLFTVLGLIFSLILHVIAWLWPVLIIAMIVIFFVKLFRDWLQ